MTSRIPYGKIVVQAIYRFFIVPLLSARLLLRPKVFLHAANWVGPAGAGLFPMVAAASREDEKQAATGTASQAIATGLSRQKKTRRRVRRASVGRRGRCTRGLLLPRALLVAARLQALPALVLVHLQTTFLFQVAHGERENRAWGPSLCPARI
jgi:hypothetical protein